MKRTARPVSLLAGLLLAVPSLAACSSESEPAPEGNDMELAEDVEDEGTVTDQMNSGAPEIAPGGGMAPGGADNPNEPVVPETAPTPDETEAAEVR